MHRIWAGLDVLTHSGPKLSCGGRTCGKTNFALLEIRAAGNSERKFTMISRRGCSTFPPFMFDIACSFNLFRLTLKTLVSCYDAWWVWFNCMTVSQVHHIWLTTTVSEVSLLVWSWLAELWFSKKIWRSKFNAAGLFLAFFFQIYSKYLGLDKKLWICEPGASMLYFLTQSQQNFHQPTI